jgi:hypothetical protein
MEITARNGLRVRLVPTKLQALDDLVAAIDETMAEFDRLMKVIEDAVYNAI